ncbi:MAG: [NiFe]-hydrogenase assembly chaperone HybE [Burkholderiales bacterium]|jgi:[NiFe] hydrogenase assembly HybE family chaperone|nr:[NiFe]-hydrogenase assembly chaperone HybE [Burkholderiales bacterium]
MPLIDPTATLEAAYRTIQAERMQGMPMVNPALEVAAVGFADWDGRWLGVMVTPWFMNLMLVPRDPAAWTSLRIGAKRKYALPAGEYEFIGGDDPAIGEYQMCSLFSPMFEFADMETARLTAKLALEAVLDPAHAESDPATAPSPAPSPIEEIGRAAESPMSKRDFLRGSFFGRADRG